MQFEQSEQFKQRLISGIEDRNRDKAIIIGNMKNSKIINNSNTSQYPTTIVDTNTNSKYHTAFSISKQPLPYYMRQQSPIISNTINRKQLNNNNSNQQQQQSSWQRVEKHYYQQQQYPKFSYINNNNNNNNSSSSKLVYQSNVTTNTTTVNRNNNNVIPTYSANIQQQHNIVPMSQPTSLQAQQYNNQKTYQTNQIQLKRAVTFTQYESSPQQNALQQSKKSYKQDTDILQQQDLINKLDLSSSQYSGIFDQQQQQQEIEKTLQCKVQVILQIGTGTTARLEIYNIELYSNRQLRIVSLYGRQFQTHYLHSMKPLPNNYYELIFDHGKIHSRRCKFRGGNFQPFLKYLISS